MVTTEKSREVLSSVDRVWDTVSDTDEDEAHRTALRDVKVLRKDGNTIEREADVGPRAFAHKSRQTRAMDPKKSIQLTMAEAPMGERSLVLVPLGKNNTRIDVFWRFEVKDAPGFVQGLVKGQISKAIDEALKRINEEAEHTIPAAGGKVSR